MKRADDPQIVAVRALRRHFARHNRLVLLVALLTLLVAASMWLILYAGLSWIALIVATLDRGLDAHPPDILPALFIYSGGLLVLITWIAHRRAGNDAPRDEVTLGGIVADLLLAVPRATLAVWGNLRAYQRLSDTELLYAAQLLARLERERRIPFHHVAQEIPDPAAQLRILLALQLTELLHVSHADGTTWLRATPRTRALEALGRRRLDR